MGFIFKIVVVVVVVIVAWSGWRWWQRIQSGQLDRPRPPAPPPPQQRREETPALKPVDDMRPCAVCGDYIAINARRCDRPTCPRG